MKEIKQFIKFLGILNKQKEKLDLEYLKKEINSFEGDTKIIAIFTADKFLIQENLIKNYQLLEIFFFGTQNGGSTISILEENLANKKIIDLHNSFFKNSHQINFLLPNILIKKKRSISDSTIIFLLILFSIFLTVIFKIIQTLYLSKIIKEVLNVLAK